MRSALLAFLCPALLSFTLLLSLTTCAIAQSDTVTAQVIAYPGPANVILKGPTHNLSLLEIRTFTMKSAILISGKPDTTDDLLIVKDGELNLNIKDSTSTLDAGSIALIPAGISYSLEAKLSTYYRFRFKSRQKPITGNARTTPFIIRWADIPVQQTAIGETRQIFSLSTPQLAKIGLHATTLNAGQVSHPPHIHRAEEIILMRTGHVQEYINGKRYPATDGDLIYLPSGNPHALENHGAQRAVYFALQWEP